MSDINDECNGWREQCETNEAENIKLRGLLIEARDLFARTKEEEPLIDRGVTTLDMLYHNYPWLKDKIERLERQIGELKEKYDDK